MSGQHTGNTDIPLTDTGRRQAEALGARAGGLGERAEVTDDLREWRRRSASWAGNASTRSSTAGNDEAS